MTKNIIKIAIDYYSRPDIYRSLSAEFATDQMLQAMGIDILTPIGQIMFERATKQIEEGHGSDADVHIGLVSHRMQVKRERIH